MLLLLYVKNHMQTPPPSPCELSHIMGAQEIHCWWDIVLRIIIEYTSSKGILGPLNLGEIDFILIWL
jgi:hypothetical protein